MIQLTPEVLKQAITEIKGDAEKTRRSFAKRRHDIYKDGGRAFLIEQLKREFGEDGLQEMRLAPINLLKKIINKRSTIYKKPPVRKTKLPKDQALVDFYTAELKLNTFMQKANRYYNLFSNTTIYTRPNELGLMTLNITPSYLYSVIANPYDQTKIEAYGFNCFSEGGMVAHQSNVPSATGFQSFNQETGFRTSKDLVGSNESEADDANRMYIWWSDTQHITTNNKGVPLLLDPTQGEEQWLNPIMRKPVVNVAKDRDDEAWATQGEDLIDLTIAIQLGWTDVLSIAKHQGFATPVIMSEEQPNKMVFGLNKGIWLKLREGGPTPSVSYVQPNSPLEEYKGLLMELLALLMSTNDMDPRSIGGTGSVANFTSGFHALIAASDNLEAVEADKPVFLDAEKEQWDVISKWHNFMFDSNILAQEARNLGKFSPDFEINVVFAEVKPLESEDEIINRVKLLRDEGLITKKGALKKLNPDLTDDQIDEMMQEIDAEKQANVSAMQAQFGGMNDQEEDAVEPQADDQQDQQGT